MRGEEFGEEVSGDVDRFFFRVDVDDPDEAVGEFAGDGADQAGEADSGDAVGVGGAAEAAAGAGDDE